MKKLLLISAIVFLSFSCSKKDEPTPQPASVQQPNEIGVWNSWMCLQHAYNQNNQYLYSNMDWLVSMELRKDGTCIIKSKTKTVAGNWYIINNSTLYLDGIAYNITQLTSSSFDFTRNYTNSNNEKITEEYYFSK